MSSATHTLSYLKATAALPLARQCSSHGPSSPRPVAPAARSQRVAASDQSHWERPRAPFPPTGRCRCRRRPSGAAAGANMQVRPGRLMWRAASAAARLANRTHSMSCASPAAPVSGALASAPSPPAAGRGAGGGASQNSAHNNAGLPALQGSQGGVAGAPGNCCGSLVAQACMLPLALPPESCGRMHPCLPIAMAVCPPAGGGAGL